MSHATSFPEARKPSAAEVKGRSNVIKQAWRFAVLNLKMIAIVTKGHH